MNIPLNIDWQQILLHLLNFVILAAGLTFLIYNPVKKFMDNRRAYYEKIEKDNAEKAKQNEELNAEYVKKLNDIESEISLRRAEAEKKAAEDARRCLDEAKAKAVVILSNAEKDAESRKEHILDSAQTEIGEMVISATEKLLRENSTPEKDSALYDEFLKLAKDSKKDGEK